ncbi:SagB/ThcOx family dehydrogenase [Candidatus Bipolaricaulota bacterium]|nr:SagB/ThcOx family dehydrogenase [Candidatus Bipolaricaulota bacterium]
MALVLGLFLLGCAVSSRLGEEEPLEVKLPEPRPSGEMSVEEALAARRSVRSYQDEALSLTELAQLLWAAQGITAHWGGRTAPSAGATYPLEVYAVVGEVTGLEAGVFHYRPDGHLFVRRTAGDLRGELASAALGQEWVREAPVSLVIAARYERTTGRYGERGVRYVHIEVGHAGQNIYLQAEALGLGTVIVGAFDDQDVKTLLGIEEEPLAIMPVGRPAD